MTMIIFIRPNDVHKKSVVGQFYIIALAGILIYLSKFLHHDWFMICFHIAEGLYLMQLVFYTRLFHRAYQTTRSELNDYYDEEEESRIYWVKIGYYGALTIGIMVLFVPYLGPWFFSFFVIFYMVYYCLVAFRINYYQNKMAFMFPVFSNNTVETGEMKELNLAFKTVQKNQSVTDKDAEYCEQTEQLKTAFRQWTDNKMYLLKDVPKEDIIKQLNTDIYALRRYMKNEKGPGFSQWRNPLRIREACLLFMIQSDLTAEQICKATGFNNSSNFHKLFQEKIGKTTREFRKLTKAEQPLLYDQIEVKKMQMFETSAFLPDF